MAREKLTPREAKFVRNLLDGRMKAEAAELAGCPPASAANAASRMLSRDRVLEALRAGAEAKMKAGVAIGAAVLIELAEKGRSEDVRLRAATALLDRGGMPLVKQSEHRHIVEDRRTDRELLEHARQLAAQLGVKIPANIIDVPCESVALPAPAEPAASPPDYRAVFDDD